MPGELWGTRAEVPRTKIICASAENTFDEAIGAPVSKNS
jgi:hypothetical protein